MPASETNASSSKLPSPEGCSWCSWLWLWACADGEPSPSVKLGRPAPGVGVACGSRETTIREWERGRVRREATRRRGKGRRGPRGWLIGMYREAFASFAGFAGPGARASRVGRKRAARRGPFGVWGIRRTVDQSGGRSGGLRTVRVAVRADAGALAIGARDTADRPPRRGGSARPRRAPIARARSGARRQLRSSERRRRLGRRRDHRARRDHHARAGARTSRRRPKPRGG